MAKSWLNTPLVQILILDTSGSDHDSMFTTIFMVKSRLYTPLVPILINGKISIEYTSGSDLDSMFTTVLMAKSWLNTPLVPTIYQMHSQLHILHFIITPQLHILHFVISFLISCFIILLIIKTLPIDTSGSILLFRNLDPHLNPYLNHFPNRV